jgi:hypothetical protein
MSSVLEDFEFIAKRQAEIRKSEDAWFAEEPAAPTQSLGTCTHGVPRATCERCMGGLASRPGYGDGCGFANPLGIIQAALERLTLPEWPQQNEARAIAAVNKLLEEYGT